MKRDLYQKLIEWKTSKQRKPLVLRGARQVGKTTLLKHFGKSEFGNVLYINFEEMPKAKEFFAQDLNPQRIIRDLSIYFNQEINPLDSLIFFDEIQECPDALTSLKYFQEQANDYAIVSAGSLLGVKLAKAKGFPVGKVNFMTLYPCTFFEFLSAIGKEKLRLYLEQISNIEPLSDPIHAELLELLRFYYYVGGMPEAVASFSTNKNLNEVRKIHQDILDAYLLDFSKHALPNEIMKITNIWQTVPAQLAKENKKFTFADVKKTARAREYENALQWLIDAGLIYRSYCISTPRLPIESYIQDNIFKIFMLDVGLLSTMSQVSAKTILEGNLYFSEFKGALTENFIAQELKARSFELNFWKSKSEAEVDFILSLEEKIYPIEVKSGTSTKQKSLAVYREKYYPPIAVRVSTLNLKQEKDFHNYPLYLIGRFPITTS